MNYDKKIWKGLIKLWNEANHCMVLGSSKETLAYWYEKVNGYWVHPKELRRGVEAAVYAGLLFKDRSSYGSCWRFKLTRGK